MTETRSPDDLIAIVLALQKKVDDMESTTAVRLARRPTGDIESTIRTTEKTNTLFLKGQTVNRVDYPVLWQFAQDQSLVIAGYFTNGNGTTTFGLPNFQGRLIRGAGVLSGETYNPGDLDGSAFTSLSLANMPNHDHNVTNSLSHAGHAHGGFNGGNHGGHFPGTQFVAAAGTDFGFAAWNSNGVDSGVHNHGMSIEVVAGHTINETAMGSGTAFDNRDTSITVNWLIYV